MAKGIVSYGKYRRAQNYIFANKRYMRIIKDATSRASISTVKGIINGSIFGGVSGGFFSVEQNVFVDLKQIDRRLTKDILDDQRVFDVMTAIKLEAQKNTPVDKRYIGRSKNAKIGKNFKFSMPIADSIDKRRKGFFTGEDKDLVMLNSRYSIERQKQISKYILNDRNRKNNLWFEKTGEEYLDKKKENKVIFGNINFYRTRVKNEKGGYDTLPVSKRNIRIATEFTDNKWHYGEEELKRSADYDEKNHIISFDPTRLGTKYNYAALQHDNLMFKHKKGMAMFLYKAYTKNQNNLLEVLNAVAEEKLNNLNSKSKKKDSFDINRDVSRSVLSNRRQTNAKLVSNLRKTLRDIDNNLRR